jgi:hypothetical protein
MTHLGSFLSDCAAIRRSAGGTRETSYYTAINNLLDSVGAHLKPKVRCVMQLKDLGAGSPDGGLFTQEQFDRRTSAVKDISSPARGVVEVKSPAEAVSDTATSAQVAKYWGRYKLVLVTNLRDWQLIGERQGKRVFLERFTLAHDEPSFWNDIVAHPVKAQQTHGQAFADFLQRVLQHNAPLAEPKDLAALLASYAREARHRVEHATEDAAKQLASLQSSLESSLGVRFHAAEGAHFFRSTLVQTLFYGVFSAWVLRHEDASQASGPGPFDWKSAAHSLNVPMIAALFGQLSQPAKLKALKLTEVLDWAADALNRVDTAAFFKAFETTRSIQYFYEPFLAAFDPELRKKLGVWYTPEEIVRYQVARVDQVLQSELGLANGLADPKVVVLDPCCGTGAYLVEVLRVVGERLTSQGADALAAHQIKEAALTRLFGFELLPAPYVVAHLQIGLLLRQWGAPLGQRADGSEERAGVYLTNALTGWEPPKEPKNAVLPFPEFDQERDAADHIKRDQHIIVILGNPPYDAFGGVALGEEQDLVAPYKAGLAKDWGIRKFNLDDLYVRFFRLAERRIAEKGGGRGVVSFISNASYVREPSFVVMRKHLAHQFDQLWIDNLNGDSRETGKTTPDGLPDPSVFSTPYNREGIRKGTAVALMVKSGPPAQTPPQTQVRYRDWWGTDKRQALLHSLDDPQREARYARAQPAAANKYSLKPGDITSDYAGWPSVKDLAGEAPINGLMEKRGGALMDMDKAALANRMRAYFDKSLANEAVHTIHAALLTDAARYDAKQTRVKLLAREEFNPLHIVRYAARPFDVRHAYFSSTRPLWNEPRPTLWKQHQAGNRFLATRPAGVAKPEGVPFMLTRCLGDNDALRGHAYYIPLQWHQAPAEAATTSDLFAPPASASSTRANLSPAARAYLAALGLPDPDQDSATAELLWMHALAVGYSPAYLADNADGIAQDWPRIPLPAGRDALLASAALGREVAALLDTEAPVPGVTSGSVRPALHSVAVVSRVGGGSLRAEEFALTAGWGSGGQGSVTMPGRGRLEPRAPDAAEQAVWGSAPMLDVYLNDQAYWKNIPQAVWDFTIGGYQVVKKWLSYREQRVLGRALTMAEIMEVTATARRLGALVLLQAALDTSYRVAAAAPWQARS